MISRKACPEPSRRDGLESGEVEMGIINILDSYMAIAACGLLIPVVYSGRHAGLTWFANGFGLALAAILISTEWLARSSQVIPRADVVTPNPKLS
jgi:hypothetical protein